MSYTGCEFSPIPCCCFEVTLYYCLFPVVGGLMSCRYEKKAYHLFPSCFLQAEVCINHPHTRSNFFFFPLSSFLLKMYKLNLIEWKHWFGSLKHSDHNLHQQKEVYFYHFSMIEFTMEINNAFSQSLIFVVFMISHQNAKPDLVSVQ